MVKDLFSSQAENYATYRPSYPKELFDHVLQYVANNNTAWDCATGNGQAALSIAPHFIKVFATDISEKQILHAKSHANLYYEVAAAEHTNFPESFFDLITVAQAYHWFRFEEFEKEVRRVAKKNAVIAVWGYNLFTTKDAAINSLIEKFYTGVVGPYWDAERRYVDNNYSDVPFPFASLPTKDFFITAEWGKDDVAGYLSSWSSVQHFINANKYNPIDEIINELDLLWQNIKPVSFPLFLKLGRVEKT